MSIPSGASSNRRTGEFALAVTCLVALVLIAVSLSGVGGAGESEAGNATLDSELADDDADFDPTELIGGGSLGRSDHSPIGGGVGGGSTPFGERSAELQFFYVTETPDYWRVDAYDTYANGSWMRTGQAEPLVGELEPQGPVTTETTRQVLLQRDAVALPVAWQPARIDDETLAQEDITLSPETGLHANRLIPAGEAYTVDSYCYRSSAEQLRNASGEYPVSIQNRYTQLPKDVPDRVVRLSNTTAGEAASTYEAAVAVEEWLRMNRDYDVTTTHDTGADPVVQFLFEMDGGNAEYMASSMVVLLRAQGIPARYVTGYSPGEELKDVDDAYAVRAVNAHAWVEVYVPRHGWVPFDPTPVEDRASAEQAVLGLSPEFGNESVLVGERVAETGGQMLRIPVRHECPSRDAGEDLDADADEPENESTDGQNGTDSVTGSTDPAGNETDSGDNRRTPITFELSETPLTPGESVTLTVTRNGTRVERALVLFNNERVGRTDSDGQVTGTVPFTESLQLTVRPDVTDTDGEVQITTVTVPVATQVAIVPDPIPLVAGGQASIKAQVNDAPLPRAEVRLNGNVVARTDANGEASFDVPDGVDDSARLTVRREGIEGERTVTAGSLDLAADPARVLALPGQTVTLTATVGSVPVNGAEISRGGTVLATTNGNGTATLALSAARETTVAATYAGQRVETRIENRLLFVTAFGLALLGLVVAGTVLARRYVGAAASANRGGTARIQGLTDVISTMMVQIERAVVQFRRRLATGVRPAITGTVAALMGGLRRAWCSRWSLVTGVVGILVGLWRAMIRILRGVYRSGTGRNETEPADGVESTAGATGTDSGARRGLSVRDAWAAFVRLAFRRIDTTLTPGELAQRAIEKGFPAGPVRRLTRAFRAAAYGPADAEPPAEEANDALTELETTADASGQGLDRPDRER